MNAQDVAMMQDKISRFQDLNSQRNELYEAIRIIDENNKGSLFQASAFTGNTRESRKVLSMTINFTRTLGGEAPTQVRIDDMHIDAWELGKFLKSQCQSKLDLVNAEIEKL